MSDYSTRFLQDGDKASWRPLFDGYATFYRTAMTDAIADRVWSWLLDPEHVLEGLVVLNADHRIVGLLHVRACPRPLAGGEIGFVDDMFITPDARGSGAADSLLAAVRELASERRWPAVRWVTQHYNARGRGLYDRYTGGPSDFIMYHWPLS